MAKKTYDQPIRNFTGKVMYCKIKEPAKADDPQFSDAWETDLLLRDEDLALAEQIGIKIRQNEKYTDFIRENGFQGYSGKYIKTRKYTTKAAGTVLPDGTFKKKFDESGPVKEPATPPLVRDGKGHDIAHADVPFVGNGSDVALSLVVTPATTKAKGEWGSRWISMNILNLVEYKPTASAVPTGDYVFDPSASAPAKTAKVDDLEDDLPF